MKKFKDFLKETQDILGYASLRDQGAVDSAIAQDKEKENPQDIIAYASLVNHEEIDQQFADQKNKSLQKESFTIDHTIERNEFAKNFDKYADRYNRVKFGSKREDEDKRAIARNKETDNNYAAISHHVQLEVPAEKKKVIKKYTYRSRDLNSHLIVSHRENADPKNSVVFKSQIKALDSELNHDKNKTTGKLFTYSAVGEHVARSLSRARIGSTVHFPAYTSTSIDEFIPRESFGDEITPKESKVPEHKYVSKSIYPHFGIRHLVVFHLPEGYHRGRYIAHMSHHGVEREFLLARDQKFRLKERRYDPQAGIVYHHLEPH